MEKIPSRVLRKMGYKADSQGIIDRFINVSGSWEDHLQHTRSFIIKAVTGKKIKNLAVYGSGWLLDLPLEELCNAAEHIQLYDLVHSPQVMHRLRNYKTMRAVQADITGGTVLAAYESVKQYKKQGRMISPEHLCARVFQPVVIPDYTISLNILSQLGVMITDYLKLHVPYTAEQTERINLLLQQSHLNLLESGKSCLITDVREIDIDMQSNREVGNTGLISCTLPQAARMETWDWQFDPHGGYKPELKTVFQVVAIEL